MTNPTAAGLAAWNTVLADPAGSMSQKSTESTAWSPERGQELPDLDVIRTEYGDREVPA